MKILIVEDSEPMRRVIKAVIANPTDETFECGDGCEALAAYREHQPDLVLMDLKMAGMDGFAATRQIRHFFPEAKIVIVSQWDDPALRAEARRAGAEDYVSKSDLRPLRSILAGVANE